MVRRLEKGDGRLGWRRRNVRARWRIRWIEDDGGWCAVRVRANAWIEVDGGWRRERRWRITIGDNG